jgi:sugar phosphate isomerase/epimerase
VAPIRITCVTASYVAAALCYEMSSSWSVADRATNELYAGLDDFAARFDALLSEVGRAGFRDAELWSAHLNPAWASQHHIQQALAGSRARGIRLTGIGGNLGASLGDLERSCALAQAIDGGLLVGRMPLLASHRSEVLALLRRSRVRLAIENETTSPDEILRQIGDDTDVLGAAIDTASFFENGFDPVEATRALAHVATHMHLRNGRSRDDDAPAPLDDGAVDVQACLAAVRRAGALASVGIEVFSRHTNPTAALAQGRELAESWLTVPASLDVANS